MSRWLRPLAVAALTLAALLAFAWTGRHGAGPAGPPRVALFVNGTLGDKSFFDAAARGLRQAGRELGLRTQVIEGGRDPTRWEPALVDLADSGDFDLIVTGTFAMVEPLQRTAQRYRQARFIVFDAAVDPAQCRCDNVHSLTFRPREAALVAGYLAAQVLRRERPAQPPLLGMVGGLPIPVVDAFLDGFAEGARRAEPQARVLRQYANSFSDPATAKDIAKALYAQGAGLVFQVAGGSGQGVIEAAAEAGHWVIGVDADQYQLYAAATPARAAHILTSVMKHVDVALLQSLRDWRAGRLAFGQQRSLGLAEGGVSLATSAPAWQQLPAAEREALQTLAHSLSTGDAR